MLTEFMQRNTRIPLCGLLATLLVGALVGAPGVMAQGQYRSRVMISPNDQLGQDSVMSVEELEQQIGSIEQPYAKSSAGRHLARHYVQEKEYAKAQEYYRTALAAKGLSDIANREMLRELAQVYMLQEDYRSAVTTLERALRIKLQPEVTDYLLLAQANYRLKKYVAVVDALDTIGEKGLTLDATRMKQALALYYGAGAYEQSASLLRSLVALEPDNAQHWHQLAAVYLQQGNRRKALDQLVLAREKGIPFTESDVLLLADLQAVNKNPYGAAESLQSGLTDGTVAATGANYRKLFQFWLQAREQDRARVALQKAAGLSGDPELYLYLAQLQMEQQEWGAMQRTLVAVCAQPLEARYVGKANFLLGVSRFKQGDSPAARRLFINATQVGGANAQAAQWLGFMEAAPATAKEIKRIVGPCYDDLGKKATLASLSKSGPGVATAVAGVQHGDRGDEQTAALESDGSGPGEIAIKTVSSLQIFYLEQDQPLTELLPRLRSVGTGMGIALVKSGGSMDGPVMLISQSDQETGTGEPLQVALPTRGRPRAGGRYKTRKAAAFKCAYLVAQGSGEELVQGWLEFAQRLIEDGYELTGERRILFPPGDGSSAETLRTELQIGIL